RSFGDFLRKVLHSVRIHRLPAVHQIAQHQSTVPPARHSAKNSHYNSGSFKSRFDGALKETRPSYFITLCFSLLSLTALAPQSLLADDPLTTKERYRGLSVGQWVLLQNEYVFGENLGDGSDIPNPYKNVLLLPESIGEFAPYHEVSVSEETALVVPFAFFVGEVYVDGTVLPSLDEGEHTIEIIESSIDSNETITYRIFVNEEMEEDDDDDDDEEQGDDRRRGSNDDDRKRSKKRRR
ncbi:MAG: hypothetical protein ACON4H_02640, partial [Rubripirellula sp.]